MPENVFSVKIESKLKSLAKASKFGRSSWRAERRVDVEAGAARASRGTALPKKLVSRSRVQALSTLKVGITREALRRPSGKRLVDRVRWRR